MNLLILTMYGQPHKTERSYNPYTNILRNKYYKFKISCHFSIRTNRLHFANLEAISGLRAVEVPDINQMRWSLSTPHHMRKVRHIVSTIFKVMSVMISSILKWSASQKSLFNSVAVKGVLVFSNLTTWNLPRLWRILVCTINRWRKFVWGSLWTHSLNNITLHLVIYSD